jgi:excinuclease ABC subunit A
MSSSIFARGVRVHNLKSIDVEIPVGKLVVVTGVSGSGKSSLAFDTLYAEGQRRYVESLSVYARQFLERMERPDVRSFDGLCPTIALRQRTPARSPRSTVATTTEIHDHLRLLFARVGRTSCAHCGEEVVRDTPQSAADRLLGLPEGSTIVVGFRTARGRTPLSDLFDRFLKRGYGRLLLGDAAVRFEDVRPEAITAEELVVVVDRLAVNPQARTRLADSLEAAFAEGGGVACVRGVGGPELRFSERFECARCGSAALEPEPRLFSFNNPKGACPRCHGFGNLIEIDHTLVVPDGSKSLAEGAIEPWTRPHYRSFFSELRRFAGRRGLPMRVPWEALDEADRRAVLEGDEEFPGVVGFFRWLEARKYKVQIRVLLARYRGFEDCPECRGGRLRREALLVHVGGKSIDEVSRMTVEEAADFLGSLRLSGADQSVAARVVPELRRRLGFLSHLGLGYLTLDRPTGSLSGGEAQRIGLATCLGSGLVGTLYVLDEPSVGLHPRDIERLIRILRSLRDQGNTVLVVEHEASIICAADHVLDLGPGAGEQGGRLLFQGSPRELLDDGRGLTGKFLRGELGIPVPPRRRRGNGLELVIRSARAHNLQHVTARIPLGALTCVTGVSGSGKSTLIQDVLCRHLLQRRGGLEAGSGACDGIDGAEWVESVEIVDQAPIGRSPRSNPVTYLKAYDLIRDVYAATKQAHQRGLSASQFSFNVAGGRCEACAGDGQVRIDMQFLADVYLRCEECGGRRFRPEVLGVRYKGRSIHDVLEMSIREALQFFSAQPRLKQRLKALDQIGLGYLRLGQPATTLSGGEAQRIKLAAHLLRRPGERVLYVLDEPTTGLHMADVSELLGCFQRLLDAGATLVVIEHNMDVVKQADWVIDLGPEGGRRGGRLVFQGTPEDLAAQQRGSTARHLRAALQGEHALAANQA